MNTKISLKGQEIYYDETTKNDSVVDVLLRRFSNNPEILTASITDLHNPYLLKDMDKAIDRIKRAKENGEKVMIFGDYDVDGVTSTSLMVHILKKLWILVSYRLPHRVEDGYGLKTKFVDEDREIVTDAKNKWLDIIVTDHER